MASKARQRVTRAHPCPYLPTSEPHAGANALETHDGLVLLLLEAEKRPPLSDENRPRPSRSCLRVLNMRAILARHGKRRPMARGARALSVGPCDGSHFLSHSVSNLWVDLALSALTEATLALHRRPLNHLLLFPWHSRLRSTPLEHKAQVAESRKVVTVDGSKGPCGQACGHVHRLAQAFELYRASSQAQGVGLILIVGQGGLKAKRVEQCQ